MEDPEKTLGQGAAISKDESESPTSLVNSIDDSQDAVPTEVPTPTRSIIVDWDENDPENPQNFPRSKKFLITCTFAGLTLTFTFGSSIFSAATLQTSERFDVSPEVMILATSLYLVGFGFGPIIFGPMSELYGRKIPLFFGFVVFAILQIPVAVATNLRTVMIFRFLQGQMLRRLQHYQTDY
ncbi:uncharacterized protein LTR77_004191 [Saxophila tyrrhenica]|uniref:Major facilitator superfamily (MFS) profile domain-containing protein n=1 Tax=Saxophila tyrrhenica TaxID=1690608 RepID=A0AAV9PC36_9PEZI|nr:hypothetical protein LTR77_004191 [Saxophila tyrrhenica]